MMRLAKHITPMEELGRHSRRSRVIWHSESIPPFSSLWITVQRFLMLNQPTRAAFAQDFLGDAVDGSNVPVSGYCPRLSLNDYQLASDESPVRLTRFARVLKESTTAFRGCHIGQYPKAVRPYFGDFAVCPYCLAEGFHSVLYSFEGLRVCPAHGTRMERLKNCGAIASDLFVNALRNPLGICSYLQKTLKSPQARTPKKNVGRDRALGEIANWLMNIESRCWLGRHGAQQIDSLPVFTNRLVDLKTHLGLADAAPNWAEAIGKDMVGATKTEVIRFGSMKVRKGDLVHIDDRQAVGHQTDLNAYGQTIFGDFKSIRRNLKRRLLGNRGRQWLDRLTNSTDNTDIGALLSDGGEQARRAWLLHTWWRNINEREFNPKVGLHIRPMRFAIDGEIPLWVASFRFEKPAHKNQDDVHLWIARWISAAGLVGYWHSIFEATNDANETDIASMDKGLASTLHEPEWGLGISASGDLVLCLNFTTAEKSIS